MGKCMIGPKSPSYDCPECNGECVVCVDNRSEFVSNNIWSVSGEWISRLVYVTCDICAGSGKIIKRDLDWYKGAYL